MICDVCNGILKYRRNLLPLDHRRIISHDSGGSDNGGPSDHGTKTEDEHKMVVEGEMMDQDEPEYRKETKNIFQAQDQEIAEGGQEQTEEDEGTDKDGWRSDEEVKAGYSSWNYWNYAEITYGHQYSSSALIKSSKAGCFICRTVWNGLSKSDQEMYATESDYATDKDQEQDTAEHDEIIPSMFFTCATLKTQHSGPPGTLCLLIKSGHLWDQSSPWLPRMGYFYLLPISVDTLELDACSTEDTIPMHTFSDQSITTVKRWLNECSANHLACNRDNPDIPWYPTRLLDLGDCGEHEKHVRLIVTAEENPIEKSQYLTLSHRWGGAHLIQLTRFNIKRFRDAIMIVDMPKTFREAIFVTRTLGIRYLWIDSLCIMQDKDDLSDWFHEAALMQNVYSHSHCNISASDAEDCTQGLFRNRDPWAIQVAKAEVRLQDFDKCSKLPDIAQYTIDNFDCWDQNVTHCTINQRGWVVQERYLSPRVLHFSREQLFWECRVSRACETYPAGLSLTYDGQVPTYFKSINYPDLSAGSQSHIFGTTGQWNLKWCNLVYAYSMTSLTDPNDKLIAFSGIAKQFATILDDTYVAGLWRRDLEQGLLWCAMNGGLPDGSLKWTRPAVYRAPSWSWASIDGPVSVWYWGDFTDLLFQVQDVVLGHVTQDITGRVKSGWLDLRGYLRPVNLVWHGTDDESLRTGWTVSNLRIRVDLDVTPSSCRAFDNDNSASRLFYMPGGSLKYFEKVRVLFLRVVDAEEGVFERIGLGACSDDVDMDEIVYHMDEEAKMQLPCLQYEDGRHTIRII